MNQIFHRFIKLPAAAFFRIRTDVIEKKYRTLVLLFLVIFCFFILNYTGAILWTLFFLFSFYDWDNYIVGFLAVAALISCPFLIEFGYLEYAETMSVNSWFLMIIFVVLQMINFKRYPEDYEKF